jgi:hypothetical protein
MPKRRKLIVIVLSTVTVLVVLALIALMLASKPVTSYGTAKQASEYAPDVRQMVNAQQSLADNIQSILESEPKKFADAQQSWDHQSVQSNSPLRQITGSPSCPIGQVRYTDVLNLSVKVQDGEEVDVEKLLRGAVGYAFGDEATLRGNAVLFSSQRFRVNTALVQSGNVATLRFSVPGLQDAADRTAYACYPAAKVPLSSVQQLG